MAEQAGQLRLLIATDNHLGVWEDDEIRKHDSFVAFEEILQHAHRLRVDALLLGGDLFHENKPSRCVRRRWGRGGRLLRGRALTTGPSACVRPTVVRTIQLLRKYVMNDNPVNIQVLSDQASNFSLCARRGRCLTRPRSRSRCARAAPQQHAREL
jgi:double-strand break repair protein MRE11